jgi:hypothetical protein
VYVAWDKIAEEVLVALEEECLLDAGESGNSLICYLRFGIGLFKAIPDSSYLRFD